MNKIFFQDVVPPDRRTIRNVPIMGGARRRKKTMLIEEEAQIENSANENTENNLKNRFPREPLHEPMREPEKYPVFPRGQKKSRGGKLFVTVAVVVILVFIFGMMTIFTSANIRITPKSQPVSANLSLLGQKQPLANTSATSAPAVLYEVINISKESEIEVPAQGEEMVELKAEGVITVYNNFSEDPQRLITRTRFETADGLIYRIPESIVVPGKTAAGPGMIDAPVIAEEAGEKYNIGAVDFTVPGFKSDSARFKGFYAKSKTDMTGGFVGRMKKVAESDKKAALDNLEASLRSELEKELSSQLPEGFVSLRGATDYEFKELGQSDKGDASVLLRLQATAHVMVFDKQSVAQSIKDTYLSDWQDIPVEVRNFENLSVVFDEDFNTDQIATATRIPLRLVGEAELFALVNGIEVADSLKGKSKSELNSIMSGFPAVSKASASVRPVWKGSFPDNTQKIHINID